MTNQELNKRLIEYEANSPLHVWSGIEKELDELPPLHLQERLDNYQEAPPSEIWNKIDQSLSSQNTEEKPTIPFNTSWLRYAAAAAVLIMVAVGISLFITKDHDTGLANNKATETAKSPSTIYVEEKKTPVKSSNSIDITPPNGSENVREGKTNEEPIKSVKSTAKRYLTFAKENGQTVRLSKKVFPVFDCADKATASIQKRCKENIESLQQKMANSLASPTTDFAGLIDMIKTLEENE